MDLLQFMLWAQSPESPLSGSAGWVGTGLLGAVLSWLCFVHLPAKDKQLAEKDKQLLDILNLHRQDQAIDRKARHDAADAFQSAVMNMAAAARTEREARDQIFVAAIEKQEEKFDGRTKNLLDALDKQNSIFVNSLARQSEELAAVMKEGSERVERAVSQACRGTHS